MHMAHFYRCFVLLLTAICSSLTMELLELSCATDDHCLHLEGGKCHDSICICTARDTDEEVACHPIEESQKMTNLVGGPCPCKQPHTECVERQQEKQCFCSEGYIPSKDRRRCLPQQVHLDGHCELDSQCQQSETFSVCHPMQGRCLCKTNFEPQQGRCLAVLNAKCLNNTDCDIFGASQCMLNIQKCVCSINHVHDRNMTKCIMGAAYGENCGHNLTCQLSLGAAGQCREEDHRCGCRPMHYLRRQLPAAQREKSQDIANMNVTCQPIVPFGAYCRNDNDCQQHAINTEKDYSMQCMWGECRCSENFTLVDNDKCKFNSATALIQMPAITLQTIFIGGMIYNIFNLTL